MAEATVDGGKKSDAFVLTPEKLRRQRIARFFGEGFLLVVASFVAIVVLFIFYFVAVDAILSFSNGGLQNFLPAPTGIRLMSPGSSEPGHYLWQWYGDHRVCTYCRTSWNICSYMSE
ncbi:hypothetical protein [Prosthecochloris sp. SCSIO W1101]|uniref:hypothetical protein n=1 Tax=Prosthecochloris sp. SCSIO W1101 TaxID=2992242 RepID=UPI0039FBD1D4